MIRKSNKNLLNWIYEYSSHSIFFLVDSLDEITEVLKNGFISQRTCNIIYNWNLEVGRENWDMIDIKAMSLQEGMEWNSTKQTYVSNPENCTD